ncbi:MAG: maleylpyruvate isomerase family mycothiol-dependent enzyme [Acidimicrobiales bacterium]
MDPLVNDLAAEHAQVRTMLAGLPDAQWNAATRCEGWDVADVVLHLAQSDELAIASASADFLGAVSSWSEALDGGSRSVDEGVDRLVSNQRGMPIPELLARWSDNADRLVQTLNAMNLSERVEWVSGPMSARSLCATRISETWIHGGDIAGAVGITLAPTDRIKSIARLAWRTLPYAFTKAGKTITGPVALHLTSPSGEVWAFESDEPAVTTITGTAADLCDVASQRTTAEHTSLVGTGPDAQDVLRFIRTYA